MTTRVCPGQEVRINEGPYRNAFAELVAENMKGWFAILITPHKGLRVFIPHDQFTPIDE